jgi:hypothetical protein
MVSSGAGLSLNPTGGNGSPGSLLPPSPISGQNAGTPPVGGAGTYNFGNTANPTAPQPTSTENPFMPSNDNFAPAGPAPVMNPGQPSSGTAAPGTPIPSSEAGMSGYSTGNTVTGVTAATNRFDNTFGAAGPEIAGYLNSSGGYNSAITEQTVQAQDAAAQGQIELGLGNLKENLAAAGISPDSSVSALESSNYMSNAETQLNALNAQEFYNMWNQSNSNELSLIESIEGPQASHIASTSGLAEAGSIIGDIGALGGAAGSIITGINT